MYRIHAKRPINKQATYALKSVNFFAGIRPKRLNPNFFRVWTSEEGSKQNLSCHLPACLGSFTKDTAVVALGSLAVSS